jgi:hypothetical protein
MMIRSPQAPRAGVRYVEATSGKNFEVTSVFTRDIHKSLLDYSYVIRVHLDGNYLCGRVAEKGTLFRPLQNQGVRSVKGGQYFLEKFCFSAMDIGEPLSHQPLNLKLRF